MPEGKPEPLEFPLKGIDVTREFQLQPPGTCADAVNVRSRDSIDHRNRGGSRPGYSKQPTDRIPEGATVIQHLNVIVDPTDLALPQNFTTPGNDWVVHPRIPNLFVPPGGAGWQPNPNAAKPQPPATAMTINVTLTPFVGTEDVTILHVECINTADDRTGSSSYSFGSLGPGLGDYLIECKANLGVLYPSELKVNGAHVSFGSSGNNLVATIPYVAGTSVSVEFIISFG